MQSKVAPFAAASDPTYGRPKPGAAGSSPAAAKGAQGNVVDEADLRLVIEEDQASGTYVYTTIDRRTGQVVQQLPQEEILRMRDSLAYLAGRVIRTKA